MLPLVAALPALVEAQQSHTTCIRSPHNLRRHKHKQSSQLPAVPTAAMETAAIWLTSMSKLLVTPSETAHAHAHAHAFNHEFAAPLSLVVFLTPLVSYIRNFPILVSLIRIRLFRSMGETSLHFTPL